MKKHIFLSLLFSCLWFHSEATIRYVDLSKIGIGTGSWSNASNDLQTMINASSSGDEIWVKAGVYKLSIKKLPERHTQEVEPNTNQKYKKLTFFLRTFFRFCSK